MALHRSVSVGRFPSRLPLRSPAGVKIGP